MFSRVALSTVPTFLWRDYAKNALYSIKSHPYINCKPSHHAVPTFLGRNYAKKG